MPHGSEADFRLGKKGVCTNGRKERKFGKSAGKEGKHD